MLTELNLRGKRLCKNGAHGVGKRGRREENTTPRPFHSSAYYAGHVKLRAKHYNCKSVTSRGMLRHWLVPSPFEREHFILQRMLVVVAVATFCICQHYSY